jgi:hypothetical protein
MTAKCIRCGSTTPKSPCEYSDVPCDGRMVEQDEPNSITINIHAEMPSDDTLASLLLAHMRELAADCEQAGWEAAVTLTLTKPKDTDEDNR